MADPLELEENWTHQTQHQRSRDLPGIRHQLDRQLTTERGCLSHGRAALSGYKVPLTLSCSLLLMRMPWDLE